MIDLDRIQGLRGTYARPDAEGVEGIDPRALERLKTEDIEAVEVSSTTEVPARFAPRNFRSSGTASCGAVVIWTKQNKR